MAYDLQIADYIVYCEASSESGDVRRAVVWTMKNRLALPSKRYGATIAEICLRRYQYSEWNDDRADNANLLRAATVNEGDPVFDDCRQAVRDVLSMSPGADLTFGATHYFDTRMPAPPSWAASPAVKTVQLGHFAFYKDVP